MPNPYFRFKKFTVYHDRCAMKVGTDGVLLGAWTDVAGVDTALDIGTGAGLVALMMAQRNDKSLIDAIDIDADAIGQAKDNVDNSPFRGRIKCIHRPLQEFVCENRRKYDLIVSNPPYFTQSLRSPSDNRTLARHTDSLSLEELIGLSSGILNREGRFAMVYPYDEKEKIILLAEENNLYVSKLTNIYPKPDSMPKRVLVELSKKQMPVKESSLVIEKARHVYSEEFVALVREFYLKL
ncbi:tRNA1Val (adenine37-N6)-methyltransferase [Dysgonomonas hofstadii]|uniref:tRNA1(Val) (adenine(37)-N6)-methyltransferase n=1 Tax=Dysgonomonas hofstadii TaxID=637886 RepID=A0A840CZG6_9BACT|nr:methyltransferase [Dysgonomonas hofstadii]MBB4037373.1 tRNA1Val (adenine37-N6)-methyltransferase [Dysgonomonas hofstadii]